MEIKQTGFSLIDSLTTLAIVAIVSTTAVPSLSKFIASNRLATQVNTFVANINLARTEAVKRGKRVVMCRSGDAENCQRTAGWHVGWIVFEDDNVNREHDNDETILRIQGAFNGNTTVSSGRRRRIAFQTIGTTPGTNATYTFCAPDYPDLARAIILSNTGRARLSYKGPRNRKLVCP